jgi:hypothetical protein
MQERMARQDIWQDGINTRFSPANQPANRGRKKGHPNRATIARIVFAYLADYRQEVEQLRRNNRNAQRRERYHEKKRAGE